MIAEKSSHRTVVTEITGQENCALFYNKLHADLLLSFCGTFYSLAPDADFAICCSIRAAVSWIGLAKGESISANCLR